jgi:AcrR family transcriptional regulator
MTLAAATKLEPRTAEILERIKAVFAAKGFDGASMQDLARSAGMSAGNFYRYFPSKNAIVEAIVTRDLDSVEADFASIMQAPSPLEALRLKLRERMQTFADDHEGPLWAEIEAAAARRIEIAEIASRMELGVIRHLLRVFAAIAGVSQAEAEVRYTAHAQLVVMLFKGASMTCGQTLGAAPSPALNALVLRMMDQLLDEIAAERGPLPALSAPKE